MRHFLDTFPEGAVLLVDTYDVRSAVKKIIAMGRKPAGIRLDSGDLVKDSRWVRRELDRAGWKEVKIFASGDLDEYKIEKLLAAGAAIDAFGVGTALGTPGDAPHLNLIYKLVEVERGGKIHEAAKFSHSKVTYPGRKQVFRYSSAAGEFKSDTIALESESAEGGRCASRSGDARRPPGAAGGIGSRASRTLQGGSRPSARALPAGEPHCQIPGASTR